MLLRFNQELHIPELQARVGQGNPGSVGVNISLTGPGRSNGASWMEGKNPTMWWRRATQLRTGTTNGTCADWQISQKNWRD